MPCLPCHVTITTKVVTAAVDLDEVVSFRAAVSSLREQASCSSLPALVDVDFQLCRWAGPVDSAVAIRVRSTGPNRAIGLATV